MILKFPHGSPDQTVKYVKSILPLVGNIKEFEVFKFYEESPYKDDNGDSYSFILRDDAENKLWLNTLCGYGGSGPSATSQILQIFGLKQDYGVCVEGNNYIKQIDLVPIHKINLLVSIPVLKEGEFLPKEKKYCCSVKLNFPLATDLFKFKDTLRSIGSLHYLRNQMIDVPDYFDEDIEEIEWAEYATNNQFLLSSRLTSLTSNQLKAIIEEITKKNKGTIQVLT